MLNSASKGKDLVEKQLFVLGGTPEQQKEFLDQLNEDKTRSRINDRRVSRKAPLSNRYTLGYTYQDVQDADGEGLLARLNIYMLSNPSAAFAPLLKPLISASVKDTLVVILLDWSAPLKWARQLRQWVRLLRSVILTLDDDTKVAMEENMTAWKEKRVGPDAPASQPGTHNTDTKSIPVPTLGPGEWDEGLGLPLSVVCVQSEKIDNLEREHGWQDEQFDFLTQWLRCVLLKHGSSLICTASFDANHIRALVHSSLSIYSLLKRNVAKPNYIERDKILIPPNWDSWGKIRPLREGTDLEAISDAWSIEIQGKPEEIPNLNPQLRTEGEDDTESAVGVFESTLHNPTEKPSISQPEAEPVITVPSVQDFLQAQFKVLEALKEEEEKATRKTAKKGTISSPGTTTPVVEDPNNRAITNPRMAEQIGPYQINVNGIDVDPEEATRRLRERESERNAGKSDSRTQTSGINTPTKRPGAGAGVAADDGNQSNEALSAFFSNLIKKESKRATGSGVGSGAVSPIRGSPAPERRLE
jgi:dynein light intermediate chain 1, cytosolic